MAGEVLNLFSDKDVDTLREMAKWWSKFREQARVEETTNTPQAPETYIALISGSGIAPLIGTGLSGEAGDFPGSAECDIYTINQTTGEIVPAGFSKTVYCLSPAGVPAGFVPVAREKFGAWIVNPPAVWLVGKTQAAVTEGNFGNVDVYATSISPITNSLGLAPTGQTVSALFLLGSSTGASYWVVLVPVWFGFLAINIACNSSSGTST